MDAKAIATGTMAALAQGYYLAPDGASVTITALLDTCLAGTRCYDPAALQEIQQQVQTQPFTPLATTSAVVNETTLQGCARLIEQRQYQRIGVLNFASAKNPGGGFLHGARAQEESLARSSGLYMSLLRCPDHYVFHRAQATCLYSDRIIYSPACPVVRDDAGNWLGQPYVVDFLTCPAPNAGAVRQNEAANRPNIVPTLAARAAKILALAAQRGCNAVVLGAWGCGVFGNDPGAVAAIFHDLLRPQGRYHRRFRHILFSVYDTAYPHATFAAFAQQFADGI